MTELTIYDFPHNPPEGYSYEFRQHNTRIISIWLRHHQFYNYKLGESIKTIWGFYSSKKNEYYAPINSSKIGAKVNITHTRPYTAMQIKLTPLEAAFL